MKYRKLISAMVVLVALAIPVSLAAQEHHSKHHKYKLIDLGTFGGPASILAGGYAVNSRGMVVGAAETSLSDPPHSNGFPCGPGTYVYHGLEWRNGSVRDLGALPPVDDSCSNSQSINERGDSAGNSETDHIDPAIGVTALRAVVWKNGHIHDLGTLGGDESVAFVINNKGQAAGFALNATPDPFSIFDLLFFGSSSGTQTRAFLWQKGAMQDLGTMGTGNDAFGVALNERGQVAGWGYTNGTPNSVTTPCGKDIPTVDPFFWDGTMTDIGTLGGTCGLPNAMNNRGQVVGQSDLKGDAFYHPFFWEMVKGKGVLTDLGTLGGNWGVASWINDAGEVIGWADLKGDLTNHPFLWKKGQKMKDLGILKGDTCDAAWGINSKTQVIGDSGNCYNNVGLHPFLWENGSIIDLNTLIPADSALHLAYAVFINDSGEIGGVGLPHGCQNTDTCGHAYVLIPCDDKHGEDGDCGKSRTATVPAQSSSTLVTQNPITMTEGGPSPSERMGALRSGFGRRYPQGGSGTHQPN
jgi:probable HAF family extracellular repeat protein